MSDSVKNWLLGLAGTAALVATGAALSMWSDMKLMKAAMENYAKGAQIAAVENDVDDLEEDVVELKAQCAHAPLWQAIAKKVDK